MDLANKVSTRTPKIPVMVGGKRVKTIDVHAHCHLREAGARLGSIKDVAASLQ